MSYTLPLAIPKVVDPIALKGGWGFGPSTSIHFVPSCTWFDKLLLILYCHTYIVSARYKVSGRISRKRELVNTSFFRIFVNVDIAIDQH